MSNSTTDTLIGFGSIAITSLAFGSQYVPIKRYDMEDG